MDEKKFTEFEAAYIECMLWSTTDESSDDGGDPLDDNYGIYDLAPCAVARVKADCDRFLELAGDCLDLAGDDSQNGHDFWLTRGGHGAGFWDRDLGPLGDWLSDLCRCFGEQWPYVGDDGLVYV